MKLGAQSHASVVSTIRKALNRYSFNGGMSALTDIFMQANPQTGELLVFNDEDEILSSWLVPEWVDALPENFYEDAEVVLRKALNELHDEGLVDNLKLLKPYSFVLVDDDKETMAELMLVDDEETMLISGDLLQGLDEELNTFLKDLLEK